jgi:hypothetical protein
MSHVYYQSCAPMLRHFEAFMNWRRAVSQHTPSAVNRWARIQLTRPFRFWRSFEAGFRAGFHCPLDAVLRRRAAGMDTAITAVRFLSALLAVGCAALFWISQRARPAAPGKHFRLRARAAQCQLRPARLPP